jgi:predicted NBD/HSP70 family sugar kinase
MSSSGASPSDGWTVKPSLDLLRSLTDEHVLRAVIDRGRLTRAEIAAHTGISKPTISESAKRLSAAGLLVDTGERTTGRGRSGSYYTLNASVGVALVVCIQPDGVSAETVDAFGTTQNDAFVSLARDASPDDVAEALKAAAARVLRRPPPVRLTVVSAADPVNRTTGRLVHLPDAPFMLGDLDPVSILASSVDGPISVDNDVNWAARAELSQPSQASSFVYLYLDEGLGCAVVADGDVVRGDQGLAGEIAHLVSAGPGRVAMPLMEVFARLGLHHEGSTSIDVAALQGRFDEVQPEGLTLLATVSRAVSSVIVAGVALADPHEIVLGGSWGLDQRVLDALAHSLAAHPRPVRLRLSGTRDRADHRGARAHAVTELRRSISRQSQG